MIQVSVAMRRYSTSQVAKMLGVQRPNLQRAIRQERFSPPPLVKVGELEVRLWSEKDVERAAKALGREITKA